MIFQQELKTGYMKVLGWEIYVSLQRPLFISGINACERSSCLLFPKELNNSMDWLTFETKIINALHNVWLDI